MMFTIIDGVLKKTAVADKGEDVIIPDGVTEIGERAFWCKEVGNVQCPESLETIGERAFEYCKLKSIALPEKLKKIGSGSFQQSNLESIIIPENVTVIGESAFNGCVSLKKVVIKAKKIKYYDDHYGVFFGCSNLTSLTSPLSAISQRMFKTGTKMIRTELTDIAEKPVVTYGLFRKEYWSGTWVHNSDCLFPLSRKDASVFDLVLAAGAYDGFNTNEDGRIEAMLLRMTDDTYPVSEENLEMFNGFLTSKITKAMKMILTSSEPAEPIVRILVNNKVITTENARKIQNILDKSDSDKAKEVSEHLSKLLTHHQSEVSKDDNIAVDKYIERYQKLNVKGKLIKADLLDLPEVLLADKSENAPSEYLGIIVSQYLSSHRISAIADEVAQKLDRDSLVSALMIIFGEKMSEKSGIAFMAPLFRYVDGKTAMELFKAFRTANNKDRIIAELLLNDSREVMMLADKERVMDKYAKMRNLTEDKVRDENLSDIGLDSNGQKEFDLGNMRVTVRLLPDLSFVVDVPGKNNPMKSLPKKDADTAKYEIANTAFAEMKKYAKKIVISRSGKLFDYFLNGQEFDNKYWKKIYQGNPLFRVLAGTIVWKQGKQTFILKDGSPITVDGSEYLINDKEGISVAHPIEMNAEEISKWQEYFRVNNLKQPFEQIWEPVVDKTSLSEGRYKGCSFYWRRAVDAEKHGFHCTDLYKPEYAQVRLDDCSIESWMESSQNYMVSNDAVFRLGRFRYKKITRKVNHIVYLLDKWTIWDRVRKDDMTVMNQVNSFKVAQISELIDIASEAGAGNVKAALMEYKHNKYPEFDQFSSFTLEL